MAWFVIELLGARVAQYCGKCIHTKIVNHSAWGKEGHNNNIVNLILFFKSTLVYMCFSQSNLIASILCQFELYQHMVYTFFFK